MKMTDAIMYARVLAGDAAYNGRFFTGVLTTGIYCLPCCKARKPRLENVRFFPSCEAARAGGLRACKKCHPDDFARGADPVLESIETLVAEIRAEPSAFPDARAIVLRSGFGPTRAFELFRRHYHASPADLLVRARLDRAKQQLLTTPAGLTEIAGDAGFESLSVFHQQFRQRFGLTPGAYRELPRITSFTVTLPAGYPLAYLRRALGRDRHSVNERLTGDDYLGAVLLSSGPALLSMKLSPATVRAEINAGSAVEAHALVVGLLGLDQAAAAFSRLAGKIGLSRLVAGRAELRISQTTSVFEGILWAIIGQQINLPFAYRLRSRLFTLTGARQENGLYAPPPPAAIARLEPSDLLTLQFSRQKADYLIATARLVVDGQLDLKALRAMSATRAERTLLAVRGLGPWSVNYLMMRSLGFADCVPYGDTGVTSGLQSLFKLEAKPDIDATRRLMAVFSPYRSMATNHLWQYDQPPPA